MAHHVHGKSDNIHISRPLPVSEQSSLHTVRACQNPKLRVTDAAPSVIVGMHADGHSVPVFQIFVEKFHLGCKHMRHGDLHRGRDIDDHLVFLYRLPHVQNRIADLKSVIDLCSRKALGAVLKGKIPLRLVRKLLQKLCTVHRKLLNLLPALSKHLLPLGHGRGIIQMHNRPGRTLYRLKGSLYDMLPRLSENLDRHILRNHIPLDQGTDEIIFRIRGGRKSHLDLLKPDLCQHPEKLKLFLQIHRLNERLVSVPKIHAAPDGRFLYGIPLHPVIALLRGHKVRFSILL